MPIEQETNGNATTSRASNTVLKTGKRQPRQLSAPPSSNGSDGRKQVSLNVTVSPNPAPVKGFQLYSVFATSPLADELFVKVSKSVCVSLSTKTAYSTSINGYLVIL
ncbi:hypothetical protein [Nostoc flagelliforme]|uniref:hypothetical protein n=1 Tax=Nostoc flagelliforme TaxID=1306274 RepID=UPI0012FD7908|nr:hypothetical protein [Nostoc flagelliforme]